MQHPIRRSVTLRIWLYFAIVLVLGTTVAQQRQQSCVPPSSSSSNYQYDWEQLNLYEILGFKIDDRSKISSSDIRQAYRSMAQKFHPDKTRGKNVSIEESNARFTRIASAYEVLLDPEKRSDYDYFLQDCENRNRYQDQNSGGFATEHHDWSYFFDPMSTDPRRVFEEFFFGTTSSNAQGNMWEDANFRQPRTSFQTNMGYDPTPPRRVQEHQEVLYDPTLGQEILRVRQTSEYNVDSDGRYFYRVVAQDFAERFDPFHGWGFHPVNQAFVLEEGYRQQGGQDPKSTVFSSTLRPGENLFPKSQLLKSENGRYYAGVSPECELLIMLDSSKLRENVDDVVVWSSETFVPVSQNRGRCYMTLIGPNLVLVLGSPDRPGNILWCSQSPAENDEHDTGVAPSYVARLDDDGRLAVYRQRLVLKNDSSSRDGMGRDHWITWPFRGPMKVPQTRAAKAWDSVRRWLIRRIHGDRHTPPSAPHITAEESCIFATGVAGCNRPVRKIVHLAIDVTYTFKLTLARIDGAIDDFVEFLGIGDDDVVETLLRVLNKAGSGMKNAGHRMAKESAQVVRDTINKRFTKVK